MTRSRRPAPKAPPAQSGYPIRWGVLTLEPGFVLPVEMILPPGHTISGSNTNADLTVSHLILGWDMPVSRSDEPPPQINIVFTPVQKLGRVSDLIKLHLQHAAHVQWTVRITNES